MALGPPHDAVYDSSHSLFANSDSLDLDVLAGEQLSIHHNGGTLPADVYCLSFLQEIFALISGTHDTNGQGQKDAITLTVIFVLNRRKGIPRPDSVLAAFVAGIVRHTALPPMEELK
jgi:hypothetical protein